MIILNKYELEFEKYKYDGFLLLHKLIDLLKNLSHIKYDKNSYISQIFEDKNLKMILNLNTHKFSQEKILSINNYIITLISKYEIICKYIVNKNEIEDIVIGYSNNDKLKNNINDDIFDIITKQDRKNSIKAIKEITGITDSKPLSYPLILLLYMIQKISFKY